MSTQRLTQSAFEADVQAYATDAQKEIYAKMLRMGWVCTEMRGNRLNPKGTQRLGMRASTGACGWIEPTGQFTRRA